MEGRLIQKQLPPNVEKEIEEMRAFLSKMVRGQPKAIETICNQFEYTKTPLYPTEERKGPVGVVMFLGPSGVGKTELARALAKYLRGSVDALLKIQCVTLSQPHTIQSLLGAPPSYVGFDTKPLLSKEVLYKTINKPVASDPKLEALLKHKYTILSNMKITRDSIDDLANQLAYRLDQLELISEHIRSMSNVSDFLRKAGVNLEYIDQRNVTGNEEILKILEKAQTEFNIFIREREEVQAKLLILTQELRKINKAISELRIRNGIQPAGEETDESQISVILFDEIEKADRAIHNLLLQIMEEARVTLGNGEVTNLENTFIILTSNVGSREIGDILKEKGIGFSGPSENKKFTDTLDYTEKNMEEFETRILATAKRELEKSFSSEFIGRLDGVIVFRPLSRATFFEILNDQIEILSEALTKKLKIRLDVAEEVKTKILESSLHRPEVGARLLNHKLKSMLKIPLGRKLARYPDFSGRVRVYLQNDSITFGLAPKG